MDQQQAMLAQVVLQVTVAEPPHLTDQVGGQDKKRWWPHTLRGHAEL
jgi:hypothetical protein